MSRVRLWIVVATLAAAALMVFGRALQVMVFEHGYWARRAEKQHQRVLIVPSERGDIRTADGYCLATSLERVAIQIDTHILAYPELFASAAAQILGLDAGDLRDRVVHGSRAVWLAQRVDQELAEAVRRLDPSAVVLVPDSQRIYPLGSLAAPVVGFVGREELRTVGRAGFEHSLDGVLAGEPARYLAINDAVQRQLRLELRQTGRPGCDLNLTLHARLQASCEEALQRALDETSAHSASAVVLDPTSGAVLALASLPSFDPSLPGLSKPERWRLRPVQDAFEPGSSIKPFIVAAALAAGAVRQGELFDCRQRGVLVAGRWIRDHAAPGIYTLGEVLAESANSAAIELASRLEPTRLWRSLDAFGFGRRPEVGFPAEAAGILPPVSRWSALSAAGLAIGQELTASPLQLAVAFAVLANDGWLLRPRMVDGTNAPGVVTARDTERPSRVMSAGLAQQLSSMLEAVVARGTGKQAAVPGYRVAGKTGTAQRAVSGGFDNEHHVSWFAGFLPLPRPRFVIVVAIEEPQRDYWAASIAAPVFARIAHGAVHLFGIAPTSTPEDLQAMHRMSADDRTGGTT